MKEKIILISKDALRKKTLPLFGGKYWNTPNIDELAQKGTIYTNYYTAGGSTAMAFTAMALGKYLFQTDRKLYDGKESSQNGQTLFDRLYDAGYNVNIAWDKSYDNFAKKHFKCEGTHTHVHVLDNIIPHPLPHLNGTFDDLAFLDDETEKGLALVDKLFSDIASIEGKTFLWFHLPHVFRGRNSYDSDIDVFDRIIGMARDHFDDDSIFISADHGQMNGMKGKFSYGYDVENSVIQIPLITPCRDGKHIDDSLLSNTQLAQIIELDKIEPQEFIYCETAYYAQPFRKMAIVHNHYKLVYDKYKKKFYLYDLDWDPEENLNLYYTEFFDTDRRCWYSLNQRFFYPHWDTAMEERKILLDEYHKVWKNGTFFEELYQGTYTRLKLLASRILNRVPKKIISIGK